MKFNNKTITLQTYLTPKLLNKIIFSYLLHSSRYLPTLWVNRHSKHVIIIYQAFISIAHATWSERILGPHNKHLSVYSKLMNEFEPIKTIKIILPAS